MLNRRNNQSIVGKVKLGEVPVEALEGVFKDLGKDMEIVAVYKKYLIDLSNGIGADPDRDGICSHINNFWYFSNLLRRTSSPFNIVYRLSPFWSEYSGSPGYPVPCRGYDSAIEAYEDISPAEFWSGEYGDSRKRLCKFLADQLGQLLILVEQGVIKK